MALPTATEIRDYLEGYGITTAILTNGWIEARRDNFIVPWVEQKIKMKIDSVDQYIEYVSGNGRDILLLSKKPIVALVNIEYVASNDFETRIGPDGVVVLADMGMLKSVANWTEGGYNSVFSKGEKNIKVTYTAGNSSVPSDIKELIIYLTSEKMLGFIGARTGGGSLSVQGFSRNYGTRGKFQDIRNDLKRDAMGLLKPYLTNVVAR